MIGNKYRVIFLSCWIKNWHISVKIDLVFVSKVLMCSWIYDVYLSLIKVFKKRFASFQNESGIGAYGNISENTTNDFPNISYSIIPMASNCLLKLLKANGQGKDCLYGLL